VNDAFDVAAAAWPRDAGPIRAIREAVFVHEQAVPAELEWDGMDRDCVQVLARDANGAAIGTGRLAPDGKIGRMAVLAAWRRRGVGSALLDALVEIARARGDASVYLHAQVRALPFYRAHGFEPYGEPFDEAGIPHLAMRRAF